MNNFDYQAEIEFIAKKYAKHGVTTEEIKEIVGSGDKHGISKRACTIGARMILAKVFGEEDYFTIEDLMEVTGESREEAIERMKAEGVTPVTFSVMGDTL